MSNNNNNNNYNYSTDEEEFEIKKIPKKKIKPVKLFSDDNINIINNNIINDNNNFINSNNDDKNINKNINNNKIEEFNMSDTDKFIGLYEDDPKYKNKPKSCIWRFCDYCEKRHGIEYFFEKNNYCVLCWSWLNTAELDLESGEYLGTIDFKSVKDMLVKTYPLFEKSNHSNPNSIYHKINSYKEAGILHESFKKLLGFEVEKPKIQEFVINTKERRLNINYEKTIIYI